MLSHNDVRSKCIPSAKESKIRSVISLLESQLQESDTGIASFLIKTDSCEFEISTISKEEASLKFAFALSSAEFLERDLAKPRSFTLTERGGEYDYRAFQDYEVNLLPFYGESFSLAVTEGSIDNVDEDSNDSSEDASSSPLIQGQNLDGLLSETLCNYFGLSTFKQNI